MRIKILDVKNIQNEIKVKFETPIGIGTGTWNGELPALGDCTDIEIDIDDNFEWGKNITTTNSNTRAIGCAEARSASFEHHQTNQ